jgi:hypothetical protein
MIYHRSIDWTLLPVTSTPYRVRRAHAEHEKRIGEANANWPDLYADYIVCELASSAAATGGR